MLGVPCVWEWDLELLLEVKTNACTFSYILVEVLCKVMVDVVWRVEFYIDFNFFEPPVD